LITVAVDVETSDTIGVHPRLPKLVVTMRTDTPISAAPG
jgi:hypothetical protein